jgi:hypothetical protein
LFAGTLVLNCVLQMAVPGEALAQADRFPRQQDEEACTSAEDTLRLQPRGESYRRALGILMGCPVVGPRALATEWGRSQEDTTVLRLLGDASARMTDRRLLQALRSVTLDALRDRQVRLTAIRAFVGQFDPSLEVVYRTPSHPGLGGSAYVMLGRYVHPLGRAGAEPLSASERHEVLDVLRQLKTSDSDEVVQKVAGYLLERLQAMQ